MDQTWEADLAELLAELSNVQDELLKFLAEKGRRLATADTAALSALQPRERQLLDRLQACHERRGELLRTASARGLPSANLRSLSSAAAPEQKRMLAASIQQASARSRLLQHHSLTNWVLTQRSLIHLSQLLEIIGTGGRISPTYSKGDSPHVGGALVDQAV